MEKVKQGAAYPDNLQATTKKKRGKDTSYKER
jgi:hypothetical protein